MKYDIVLTGVGGQGVLSLSSIIAFGAMKENLHVKQSEVHGMAQRGGSVIANLRLGSDSIASDLIPEGRASMVLSMEPVEGLRYMHYLSPEGKLVTSSNPFINIPDYPENETLLSKIKAQKNAILLDAEKIAREAGSVQATNMVMVGAASHHLPLKEETLIESIKAVFGRKGEKVVDINIKAFKAGREAAK